MGTLLMAEPTYLSVKIREDVYRKVKTLAAWHGKGIAEYLSDLVDPVASANMAQLSKEATACIDKKKKGK